VFSTISEKMNKVSEILMQAKIFEGVVAATTLGDTLVEYQLLYFGSFLEWGLGLSGCIDSLCRLHWLPHLPHG